MALSMYSINGFFILDNEGKRLLAKYYTRSPDSYAAKQYPSMKEQRKLEQTLFKKTGKGKCQEIILYDGNVVLYKNCPDIFIYVIGSVDENELLLSMVLDGFYNTVSNFVNHQMDKRAIVENIDIVTLVLDEIIDDGVVLEVDPEKLSMRVTKRGPDSSDIQLNEQSLLQAYNTAKEKLTRTLLA